jgi:predicted nucleic acid-binding protein
LILYCDTSALVKLYIREEYSGLMGKLAERASAIAVCRIAWAEAMSALARRSRESPSDAEAIEMVRTRLRDDWPSYSIIEVTQSLVELAGAYADTFALRGYDSVQLAAARILQEATPEEFHFACFDTRLQKAAQVLGMLTFVAGKTGRPSFFEAQPT